MAARVTIVGGGLAGCEAAWQLARREFSEAELPSVATIQRSMVGILGGGSG